MIAQSFDKSNDFKPKTSHKETLKAQDLDIERESLVLPIGKGSFESNESCKNSFDLKDVKDIFCKKQEPLNSESQALNDRIIEETVLLSANKPTSKTISDQNPKEATEICEEDQDSYLNLDINNLRDQGQQESLKANSGGLRNLDLTRCLLGKHAIQALCCNCNLKSLKSLILAKNPIGNDGVKFISETSNWPKLQKLILCNIQIDYDGVKWLAANESWISLKELDLSENPLIGDLGATSLCLNRAWTRLKTLSLWSCNVGTLGVSESRRRRNYTVLFGKDKNTVEVENENFSFKKFSFRTTCDTQIPEKSLPTYPFTSSNWRLENFKSKIRGGSPQGHCVNDSSDIDHLVLLTKFQQYREKILNDADILSNPRVERELSLFIEPLASLTPTSPCDHRNCECKLVELTFDIWKCFLSYNDTECSKILLLTGETGVGKSTFCKHLQREILSDFQKSQNSDLEHENWFPIYVDLSSLKNPKSKAISETLVNELSLTEEEILLLQNSEQITTILPRLLFLFDGYEQIEDFNILFRSLKSEQDIKNYNFCVLNQIDGATWKNAKFIITCREESFQHLERRDLLFAPLTPDLKEVSIVPGSFLQRKMEPFSDEGITCFLRKKLSDSKLASLSSSAWSQVEEYGKTIDECGLRELARIPFMLRVIVDVLPEVKSNLSKISKSLTKRFLVDCFINKVIKSVAQNKSSSEENQQQAFNYVESINQQLQNLALRSNNYSQDSIAAVMVAEEDFPILELYPLVEWDSKLARPKLRCDQIQSFLIAKCIEGELSKLDPLLQNENPKILRELLLNQRLLTRQAICFLQDSVREQRLKPEQLMKVVLQSREKNLHHQNDLATIEGDANSNSQSDFAVAAVNAITILNSSGYDFSGQDLSNVCIPGANLSSGIFEGTIFNNANLEGVDFACAWLKDTSFINANLGNVDFDETPSFKLSSDDKEIKSMKYSDNGKYLALDISGETIILQKSWEPRSYFKEIRRFPGSLTWRGDGSFSRDSQQIITALIPEDCQSNEEDYESNEKDHQKEAYDILFRNWVVSTGECMEEFNVPSGKGKPLLYFDREKKQIIRLLSPKKIQKYDIRSNSLIDFHDEFLVQDLSAKFNLVLVSDSARKKMVLFNAVSGKSILKQKVSPRYCELSSDGKQFVFGTASYRESEKRGILDSIRRCLIRHLRTDGKYGGTGNCSFTLDGTHFIFPNTNNNLMIQDVANSESIPLNGRSFALHPDGKQIALLTDKCTVSFNKFTPFAKSLDQALSIRGNNNQGLNLKGSIINNSVGLSDQNILIFKEKGDYGPFDQNMMRKFNPTNLADSEEIREVILIAEYLTAMHCRIIGSNFNWINLRLLDISRNGIGEDGGQAIGNNQSWPNIEELILTHTEIGDKTATVIASNQTWKILKRLELGSNKIGNAGAAAIGRSKLWLNFETLNLRQNEIGNEGAIIIGENRSWKNLTTIDLSSNKISDQKGLHLMCSNDAWKNLEILLLQGNLIDLQQKDVPEIMQGIASNNLRELCWPKAKFDRNSLEYLKYTEPKDVVEISERDNSFAVINAMIIGSNTTWTNLKKLDLSMSIISEEGGVKIASNSFWNNLEELNFSNCRLEENCNNSEELDFSNCRLEEKIGVAIGENTIWQKLKILNLEGNRIGTKGACSIGANTTWGTLQVLNLQRNYIGGEGARDLSQNTTWKNLQTLNLSDNNIGSEGARELSKNEIWVKLETLNLENNSIGDEGAEELSKNTTWANLQNLNLERNQIGDKGVTELRKNTTWTNLQNLQLKSGGYGKTIGDKGATELSKNTSWTKLQTLNLQSNKIGDEGARDLSNNKAWKNLQVLNLSENSISGKGAEELSKNATWMNLQILNLQNNKIKEEGAHELSKNSTWSHLHTLDLGGFNGNDVGAKGAEELSKNTVWTNLQIINLQNNNIGGKGAEELSRNMTWTNLMTLNLQNNKIDGKGAGELSKNTIWTQLQTLDLGGNNIGDEGAKELSKNTAWTNLQDLHLWKNNISMVGARYLAKNITWSNLRTVSLPSNKMGKEGARELSKNTIWRNLRSLNLNFNQIDSEGATALSKNTTWGELRTLNLSYNSIGSEGARALSKNTIWTRLQTLELSSNNIGSEGTAQLSQNTIWTSLQTLNLANNDLSSEGVRELSKNTTWTSLQTLNLENNIYGEDEETIAQELRENPYWPHLGDLSTYFSEGD